MKYTNSIEIALPREQVANQPSSWPRTFHKQSQQHMRDFKELAEHGKDVRDGES